MVECGCYRGGSTIRISLVCRLVGRRLIVADSFAGLPPIEEGEGHHPIPHQGRAEEYDESLSSLNRPIVAAFLDVDLVDSLKPCPEAIWARLQDGCRMYVHEANGLKLRRKGMIRRRR